MHLIDFFQELNLCSPTEHRPGDGTRHRALSGLLRDRRGPHPQLRPVCRQWGALRERILHRARITHRVFSHRAGCNVISCHVPRSVAPQNNVIASLPLPASGTVGELDSWVFCRGDACVARLGRASPTPYKNRFANSIASGEGPNGVLTPLFLRLRGKRGWGKEGLTCANHVIL